jgi:hypothetical protein
LLQQAADNLSSAVKIGLSKAVVSAEFFDISLWNREARLLFSRIKP